ncbi:aspartate:alanine exchanger family transporter [Sediminitomix flava]|uniref:Putative transport protein n=1 Tax=Sediminitomix flava TaxID=379075 RepID=A0A315ZDT8_SEDFL|nr:aspartate:alanine exchanger family transporter [Sediminitomix flava]PWJ43735.1 putative transport protein [Sediminitomix flava]
MDFIIKVLTTDYFALFLIIGLGILLGRISIKGISFGVSAIIFVALFYGWFTQEVLGVPFAIPKIIQTLGLILFIFTIGMQAGPSFFESFRSQGSKLIIMAVLAVTTGCATTLGLAFLFDVDINIAAGLFTGALTSTPGLAAAIDSTGSDLASIGYGIAYPFGVIGVILFLRLSPKLFRVDLKKEDDNYKAQTTSSAPPVVNQNFIITNQNVFGKTIGDLSIRSMTKASISRVMHGDESISPNQDTVLSEGDLVRAVGTSEALHKVELLLGTPTDKKIPRSGLFEVDWIIATKQDVVGKSLQELNLRDNYQATVVRIRRADIDLVPRPSTKIRFGDKLKVSVTKGNFVPLCEALGNSSKALKQADFLPIAMGIVIGVLLGKVNFPLPGGNEFSLGLTGGVLIAALLLSWKGKTGPIIWNLSSEGNAMLRLLGLVLFLTPVGVGAGSKIVPTIAENGFGIFGIGALITIIPMVVSTVIARVVLKINFFSALGALTGGMTSTPGLSAIEPMTDTDAPSVAYATVYPFALVTVIFCSQIIAFFA